MSQPFLGEIRMFGFNFAPRGWALCQGQTLAIAQNTALFSLLGTFYGGNGVNTFQLPDLRSRVAVGQGQGLGLSNYTIGEITGTESVTLLINEMPAHTHLVNTVNAISTTDSPSAVLLSKPGLASDGSQVNSYSNATANATMSPLFNAATGGNLPHNNIQPILCVNFCIALEGIFPSRN